MKRMYLMLLLVAMLLSLAGCASDEIPLQEKNFSFTYNGIEITLGAEAAPIIDVLGEPRSYTEEASCAFDGVDKTYYYGSFYISTCPINGIERVYTIWFADDTVATKESIRIGSSQIQVEDAYGTGAFDGMNRFTQIKNQSKLSILLENEIVTSIRYEMIVK